MSSGMQKTEAAQVHRPPPQSYPKPPDRLVKGKVNLQFIEKADRQRPFHLPDFTTVQGSSASIQDDVLSTSATPMCYGGPPSNSSDFGIGELVEEFSSLATFTPPPTPASLSSSSTTSVGNTVGLAVSNDSQKSIEVFQRPFSAPLPCPPKDPIGSTLSSSLSMFNGGSSNFLSGTNLPFPVTTVPVLNNPVENQSQSTSESNSSNISQTDSSMPSTCDGSTVNDSPTVPPRVRRRSPMCRFCYERYVHMCLDSRQPIPATYDRGMWHGHNMKERGLVTCPHLWATSCSHCGATKQHAHTDDYCPLKRRNPNYCRQLHQSNG